MGQTFYGFYLSSLFLENREKNKFQARMRFQDINQDSEASNGFARRGFPIYTLIPIIVTIWLRILRGQKT